MLVNLYHWRKNLIKHQGKMLHIKVTHIPNYKSTTKVKQANFHSSLVGTYWLNIVPHLPNREWNIYFSHEHSRKQNISTFWCIRRHLKYMSRLYMNLLKFLISSGHMTQNHSYRHSLHPLFIIYIKHACFTFTCQVAIISDLQTFWLPRSGQRADVADQTCCRQA